MDHQLGPWEAAKQRFLLDLPEDQQAFFKQWLSNEKSAAKLQDEVQRLGTKNEAVRKMKPFINGLKGLDSIISPLAGLDAHGIVTLVWGSVKVLMTLATTAIEFFESITEFLQSVGDDLSLFHEYQSLYSKHGTSRFNASLQEVYATYLHFCSRVMMFFNSSKWKKFKESTGLGRSKHSSNFEIAVSAVKIACSRAKSEVDLAEKRA